VRMRVTTRAVRRCSLRTRKTRRIAKGALGYRRISIGVDVADTLTWIYTVYQASMSET